MSDREEWRAALRAEKVNPGDCYRHDISKSGVCSRCGLTVTGDEL